jgi:hypothetical protein
MTTFNCSIVNQFSAVKLKASPCIDSPAINDRLLSSTYRPLQTNLPAVRDAELDALRAYHFNL